MKEKSIDRIATAIERLQEKDIKRWLQFTAIFKTCSSRKMAREIWTNISFDDRGFYYQARI